MLDKEYSVIKSDVIKRFDCIKHLLKVIIVYVFKKTIEHIYQNMCH